MELTRFDLQNQVIQRRIADALERIAAALEKGPFLIARAEVVESDRQWQTETSKNRT